MTDIWEWRRVESLMPGDFIHCWGSWLKVVSVKSRDNGLLLTYLETDNTERKVMYKNSAELMTLVEQEYEDEFFYHDVDHGWEDDMLTRLP